MAEQPAPTSSAQQGSRTEPVGDVAQVRRTPRYRAFALTGVVLGLLMGGLGAALAGAVPTTSAVVLGAAVVGSLGALLGALVAVLLDRAPRQP